MADCTAIRMETRIHGMFITRVDVAIDKHVIPRYGKTYSMFNTITSKFKNGTYRFFDCLTAINCTVDGGSRAFLEGATPVRMRDNIQNIVSKLVDGSTNKDIRVRTPTRQEIFFYWCDKHTLIQKCTVSDACNTYKGRQEDHKQIQGRQKRYSLTAYPDLR